MTKERLYNVYSLVNVLSVVRIGACPGKEDAANLWHARCCHIHVAYTSHVACMRVQAAHSGTCPG
jgi:hypothetical protein